MENNTNNIPSPIEDDNKSPLQPIENLIYVIRGQQVMLDSDLARLYGVETKRLKEQVRRNISRFPEDFMFELTHEECSRSQIATLNGKRGQNIKYLPFVFTENGVAMLSSVLKSETAIEVNIRIMRAFTAMRSFLQTNAHVFQRIETLEHNHILVNQKLIETNEHIDATNRRIDEVLTRLEGKEAEPIEGFFFDGQIFDAYTLISDLVRMAKTRIVLIDNYVDDRILKVLDKRVDGVKAIIYTDPRHSHIENDLRRHNAQYPAIEVYNCSNVHDRFLIIDDTIYFIGGSIKDLGKKIVAFSQMHQNPGDILTKLK